jgi:hypothetical protein
MRGKITDAIEKFVFNFISGAGCASGAWVVFKLTGWL